MNFLSKQIGTQALFRPIDIQVARFLERLDQGQCPELPLLAALVSRAVGQGHTCLPLAEVAPLLAEAGLSSSALRDVEHVRSSLLASSVVGSSGLVRPLMLDASDNLFIFRLYRDEETIARAVRQRIEDIESDTGLGNRTSIDITRAVTLLAQLFPTQPSTGGLDGQRVAAALALYKKFLLISGGPGTGKTYTAARILALLVALTPHKLRIALAAPTGKAALRLQESIQAALASLPPELAEGIPNQAQTLHRLLQFQGMTSGRPGFRAHADNPLHLDVLILDEASMIDVPLMAATLAALPTRCRVILLGDRDQLASVEVGNLFGDLCADGSIHWSEQLVARLRPLIGPGTLPDSVAAPSQSLLAESLVILRSSHRFRAGSGIDALSRAVNAGDCAAVTTIMQQGAADVSFSNGHDTKSHPHVMQEHIASFLQPLFAADSPASALAALVRCRILCALREGSDGVEGINRQAEVLLRRQGRIPLAERVYRGLPIFILRNDYHLGLFNGDTGVLWPDEQGRLVAWFPLDRNSIRSVGLASLPAWQTSYAITVHKSQGSEFERVLLVLPQEDTPLLSRELLYTAITRARTHLTLCCRQEVFLRAVQRRVVRFSGLQEKLACPWF